MQGDFMMTSTQSNTPPLDLRWFFSKSRTAKQLDDAALSELERQFGEAAPAEVDAINEAVRAWRQEPEGTRPAIEASQRIGDALDDLRAAVMLPA
jgi:hypothetical protein